MSFLESLASIALLAGPIGFSRWMGKVVSDEKAVILSEAKDLVGMSRFTYGRGDPSLRSG
jgi:hypothetical protein